MKTAEDMLVPGQVSMMLRGDCIEVMRTMPAASVDAIITDPPYGTTCNAWDVCADMVAWFVEAWRVAKPNAALCVFAQQPFATDVICAARKWFRYEIVWRKNCPCGFANANRMPLRDHELVLLFYRSLPTFNPQTVKVRPRKVGGASARGGGNYGSFKRDNAHISDIAFPRDVIDFDPVRNGTHPTEKPTALLGWLVRSYTAPGAVILDPFAGSGSTGEAALLNGRRFVGIEKDDGYFRAASARVESIMWLPAEQKAHDKKAEAGK